MKMKDFLQSFRSMRTLRVLALLPVFGWPAVAPAATFSAALADAGWHARGSVFECALSHSVGSYGTASFSRRAGEAEVFSLQLNQPILTPGTAQLQALWPDWRVASTPVALGSLVIAADKEKVRLEQERARQRQQHLEAGRRLMVLRPAASAQQSPVRVILEPIHFRQSFETYQKCLTRLLPVNFDQVKRTAIYFPEDADTLPAAEQRKLDRLIRYVKADSSIQSIVIDGHTDSLGIRPENLEVSKMRAEMIAEYLLKADLPADSLVTRWHGERYPVASNKTAQGRAQNRRVTLRLEREKSS